MSQHLLISLGRQVGSGGYLIGRLLSQKLNLAFFDKEILLCAAQASGLDPEIFHKADEVPARGLSQFLTTGNLMGISSSYRSGADPLSVENLFRLNADIILQKAALGPSIFIGRCADYILRDQPGLLRVFITAPLETRVQRVAKKQEIDEEQALRWIQKKEKERAAYYKFFTNKVWGDARSYDICLDSSYFGIEGCVDVLSGLSTKAKDKLPCAQI